MADIEDLGVSYRHLGTGTLICGSELPSSWTQTASSKSGIVEISRREDAFTALSQPGIWEALVSREKCLRINALNARGSLLDLADPAWRALVLWTKNPGGLLQILSRKTESGRSLVDGWAIYVVITMNGYHPELEPRLGFKSLAEMLEGFEGLCTYLSLSQALPPRDCVCAKVGDPLVRYRILPDSTGEVKKNWSDFDLIYATLARLGFRQAHYGPLDTRGIWERALGMAREEGIELIPFDFDRGEEIATAVSAIAAMAHSRGLRLVTCSDSARIGQRPADSLPKIRQGICVSVPAVNKVLGAHGFEKLPGLKSTKPSGGRRKCDCAETADIGRPALRQSSDPRRACHGCVYCFVRCKTVRKV